MPGAATEHSSCRTSSIYAVALIIDDLGTYSIAQGVSGRLTFSSSFHKAFHSIFQSTLSITFHTIVQMTPIRHIIRFLYFRVSPWYVDAARVPCRRIPEHGSSPIPLDTL